MVFNSGIFLVFFGLFFILYWLINDRYGIAARNIFTLISSYVFYGWWDWRFLSLIILSSATDFFIGIYINNSSKPAKRKALLILSLGINLGILGFFKYFNFFVDTLHDLFVEIGVNFNTKSLSIILPVGISFYTFQTLSYTIDIYKNKLKPTTNILSFFTFVAFFPQLVAGPIERASNLLAQVYAKKAFSYSACKSGLRLVLWGFFKKIVIADNFGLLSDSIFNSTTSLSGLIMLFGAMAFALQIYADFSGYSDIAIGISRMLGYHLMTNFKTPYFANSFSDFWKRWHISLSTWFRDYVYIPLGGNRQSIYRTYLNLLITFLLSGLWHGANSTFLIWGGIHGLLLIFEKHFSLTRLKAFYYPIFILIIILSWIPFRVENCLILKETMISVFNFSGYSMSELMLILKSFSIRRFVALGIILILFLWVEYSMHEGNFDDWISSKKLVPRYIIYYSLLILILFIGNFSVKPNFIYFQF